MTQCAEAVVGRLGRCSLSGLRAWALQHGAHVHEALSLAPQYGGVGWQTDALLEEGTTVLRVPTALILSAHLEPSDAEYADAGTPLYESLARARHVIERRLGALHLADLFHPSSSSQPSVHLMSVAHWSSARRTNFLPT